jgi:hypothetical protein
MIPARLLPFFAFAGLAAAVNPLRADAPKLPPVTRLTVQPAALTFADSRDLRSIIVTGQTASGVGVDLSPVAKIKAAAPLVTIDEDGTLTPIKAGRTMLTITAAGKTATVPIVVKSVASPPVSFMREVMPVLSRTGCTQGTCHGSAKGKNGFKLSLRGYDPDFDYHALVDDMAGRRFNRVDPDQSLMLLKSGGQIPHKGGTVMPIRSDSYKLVRQWIAEGVRNDIKTAKRVSRIEILPGVPNVPLPGMTQKTLVIAHYPDGTTRDVTRHSHFTSSVSEVVTTTPGGKLEAVRRGEASLLVRYEGQYASVGVMVLGDRRGWAWQPQPQWNYIDKLVDLKLQKYKALPAPLCDDATFLRRVCIDLTGLPPTPEQVRAFLADKTPTQTKRTRMVDKLLQSPEYVDRWTNKWADLLSANSKFLGNAGVRKFRNWIQHAVATDKPYDKFVREMLTASGDAYEAAPANFFRVNRNTETATENVTQLFLGVRFSCNKCHDHPFEKWTQQQYYQMSAFFARVGFKPGSQGGDETIFAKDSGETLHPKTNLAVAPAVPVGRMPRTAALEMADRRTPFADWLTSADNPFFSRAMVNRVWSYLLGKGIIDPVDDIRASNPPSNPELLEALNADFVKHGFRLKHIIRTIVLSRTYQASLTTNKWNVDDVNNFSHAMPRRLEAEQLFDALNQATGTRSRFDGVPEGTRAVQLPDAAVGGDGFLSLFGRPPRESPCECERTSNVSLGQALNLINGPTISDAIANPNGRLATVIKTNPTDSQLIEEVFLSTLCRKPTAKEMKNSLAHLKASDSRLEGAQDLMWALINSPAFLFNR